MMSVTKSYEEIIDFIAAGTTPEAVVAFRPSDSVQQRVAELVERSKDAASRPKTNLNSTTTCSLKTS